MHIGHYQFWVSLAAAPLLYGKIATFVAGSPSNLT